MPSIGDASKPTGGWHSYSGSSEVNQEAELLTMPESGTIASVGAWIGGWNGACDVWLTVWAPTAPRSVLGQSAMLTVANKGAGGPGGANVAQYVANLLTPVDLPAGAPFLVGFVRKQGDGHQISTAGLGAGAEHHHGRSGTAVQAAVFANADYAVVAGRIGAYVASYTARPGAWVYRSGVWIQSDAVLAYRGGAWVEVDSVSAYRSSSWIEAD